MRGRTYVPDRAGGVAADGTGRNCDLLQMVPRVPHQV
jgi:hypothetical protein